MVLSFESFPWFEDGTIREVLNVERVSATHLYWPDLDVDVHVDSIDHPENYPLVSKVRRAKANHETMVSGRVRG